MILYNKSTEKIIATRLIHACTFMSRLKGLAFTKELPLGDALLISPCNSVHTCFMRYPIDILFLNEAYRVIRSLPNLKAYRFSPVVRGAKHVIELPSGSIKIMGIEEGHTLEIKK